jgi:hypothetical protein
MPADEDRIIRIARALCRAERIDPDKPLGSGPAVAVASQDHGAQRDPAWTLYRSRAETFLAQNLEIAAAL